MEREFLVLNVCNRLLQGYFTIFYSFYSPKQLVERKESSGQSFWKSVPTTGFVCTPVSDEARRNIEVEFARTMQGKVNYVIISIEKVYNKQLYRQYKVYVPFCNKQTKRPSLVSIFNFTLPDFTQTIFDHIQFN